jgi:hypothetical protein
MQSETRSIQKQKFYQSTVAAMNAEKATAGDTKTSNYLSHTDREQPAFKSSEEYTYTVGDDEEQPAIPRAPPGPQQQLKDSEPVTEEIPIAGRTKMTVTKEKGGDEIKTDAETGAVSVQEDEDEDEDDEEEEEEEKQQKLEHEEQKVKAELNDMLKRSPSKFATTFGVLFDF